MKDLDPDKIYPSLVIFALVFSAAASEPEPGSVKQYEQTSSKDMSLPRKLSLIFWLPLLEITQADILWIEINEETEGQDMAKASKDTGKPPRDTEMLVRSPWPTSTELNLQRTGVFSRP